MVAVDCSVAVGDEANANGELPANAAAVKGLEPKLKTAGEGVVAADEVVNGCVETGSCEDVTVVADKDVPS